MRKAKNLIFSTYSNSSLDLNILKSIPGVAGLYENQFNLEFSLLNRSPTLYNNKRNGKRSEKEE